MEKTRFVYIFIGGFFGSVTREFLSLSFPGTWGTLLANMSGSLTLGYLMYATNIGLFSERQRYLVGFGFCGGLTTFSSFIVQTMQFSSSFALFNIIANIGLCLVCVFLGRALTKKGLWA